MFSTIRTARHGTHQPQLEHQESLLQQCHCQSTAKRDEKRIRGASSGERWMVLGVSTHFAHQHVEANKNAVSQVAPSCFLRLQHRYAGHHPLAGQTPRNRKLPGANIEVDDDQFLLVFFSHSFVKPFLWCIRELVAYHSCLRRHPIGACLVTPVSSRVSRRSSISLLPRGTILRSARRPQRSAQHSFDGSLHPDPSVDFADCCSPTPAKIDFPEEYVEFLSDPWQQERGEMTLLTCARKHRTMLWQRYNRTLVRRNALALRKKAAVAASSGIATSTAAAVKKGLLLTSASIPVEKPTSNQDEVTPESEFTPTSSTESTNPWRALFLAFFAIIQPDTMNERLEPENDFLDDLRVLSVPPHVSDVVSDASELFWRYDMDSYAANNHNEDRSQYVLDTLSLPVDPSEVADNNAEPESSSLFFCGCYDGHGGEQAVEYVQRNLYRNIKRFLSDGESVTDAIVSGFQHTDREFNRRSVMEFAQGTWSACSVGACAVIAMVVDTKLYVASCGDCRAIMAFREPDGSLSVEQVTLDHSANEAREQERLRILYPDDYDIVREIGAHNFYVKGRLQPTRSLGDTYMKVQEVNRAPMPRGLRIRGSFKRPYITAVPDVFEYDLADRQPEFLVLGSDGLYGEMTNDEIASTIDSLREKGVENVSEGLRGVVLERIAAYYGFSMEQLEKIAPGERRNYHDDITIDVIHFTAPGPVAEEVEDVQAA